MKRPRRVRFERHEGSGHPLRAVFPDGSWLGVDRDHEGLFFCDAKGRLLQLLDKDRFRAASPRQFVKAYKEAYGETLRERPPA
jgi:putative oxidoreductase